MVSACANLLEAGHGEVLNYGIGWFHTMCREHERIKFHTLRDIAYANRVGAHAGEQDWRKFISETFEEFEAQQAKPVKPDRYSLTHPVKRKTAKRKKNGGDSKQNP